MISDGLIARLLKFAEDVISGFHKFVEDVNANVHAMGVCGARVSRRRAGEGSGGEVRALTY